MTIHEENLRHIIGSINSKVEEYLKKTSSWWVIHPSLKSSQDQYTERYYEGQSYLGKVYLLYSILPSKDVKSLGINYSVEEILAKFNFDLSRAGSQLSPHQKLLKRT